MKKITYIILLAFCIPFLANAQYFGQNKPRYRSFDFKIKQSDHFDLYYYLKNPEVIERLSKQSEAWYEMHSRILRDTFFHKNPIILYNNHAEFQQTNTISGSIGVGTGGVTEAFKNRVVFPLSYTNQQTNHVLGHELVHAFQYHMVLNGDSTGLQSLGNLPLWMVEGLAEYMSKGNQDPFTAMWMRSAIQNDDIPTIRDLSNPEYFPYRYGQVFWAQLASKYGDQIIKPFFMYTAAYGFEAALDSVLFIDEEQFEKDWKNGFVDQFSPSLDGKQQAVGSGIIDAKNAGEMNISPSLSPNGKYVAFWSEKEVLGTNLYIAEANRGEIIRKIGGSSLDGHLDAIQFLESGGTWSKNSDQFAYVGNSKGQNIILIKEVESGRLVNSIRLKDFPAITQLAWSPDNDQIFFTALVEGQVDIYAYNLKTKKTNQITDNPYSEIMVNFNAEGTKITFSTDQIAYENERINGKYSFDIAVMDLATNELEILDIFHGADNLNPNFDQDGNILFLSDRDGYRNLYKYNTTSKTLEQLSDLATGISGITEYSPALTVSTRRDRILYSYFDNQKYTIYKANADDFTPSVVDPQDVNFAHAYISKQGQQASLVNIQLDNQDIFLNNQKDIELKDKNYKPKFKLDYIGGGTGIGVANGNFGNYVGAAGGIDMLFSDNLGNNQILSSLQMNGEIYDAGGQVAYINRKRRVAWGVGLSHIPLRAGEYYRSYDELTYSNGQTIPVIRDDSYITRIFDETVSLFAQLPFSKSLRVEAGVSQTFRSLRKDLYSNYYDINFGNLIYQERERIPTDDIEYIYGYYAFQRGFQTSFNTALVGDNAVFGVTSPLQGYRFRIGLEHFVGNNDYSAILADGRKYFWLKPVSFAVRGMAYTRLDRDVTSVYPMYIGQMGFVRGYGSIIGGGINNVVERLGENVVNSMIGSKLAMVSGEIRLPFTGPKRLSLIGSKYIFSDLALFYDAGFAYNNFNDFGQDSTPYLAMSTGISLRVNLFGYIVLEPYYAYLPRESAFSFGLNLLPGW